MASPQLATSRKEGNARLVAALTYRFDDRNTFLLRIDDMQMGVGVSSHPEFIALASPEGQALRRG